MRYRQINTNFWDDGYVLNLNQKEKLSFLYFFTNPKVNICGIYELPDKSIRYTLDLTVEELEDIKRKFQNDKKYSFYKGWIYINNFTDHNTFSTADNILNTFKKEFDGVPLAIKQY